MRTILCVPGTWPDRGAFLISAAGAGMPAAGSFIVDTLAGTHLEFEHRARDARMREAFDSASGGEIDEAELEAIEGHQSVVYLLGETGDLDRLRPMIAIASRLLLHGALGIKVESAGVAAPIENWLALSQRLDPFGLIRCFVVVAAGKADTYSCGMHNLGFPDVVTSAPGAKQLIDRFNLYQLIERPVLEDGQTFAAEQGARGFVLSKQPCTEWPADDPFHNPFGMWRLSPVAATTRAS